MIQFNLLPDVKLAYVRAQRVKRAVASAAVISGAVAIAIFALLFIAVHLVQAKVISDQTKSIKQYSSELQNTPDLTQILTVQQQLGSLPALHAAKPAADRTFGLISRLTPQGISLTKLEVDHEANTISVAGVAPTLDRVNTMADAMKYVTFTVDNAGNDKVFSDVTLAEFTRSATGSTFTLKASFEPSIYENTKTIGFIIPAGVSTQSVANQPGSTLFTKPQGTTR